jgi:riboflavin biosynthesis pyrimidine reductase
MQQLLPPVAPGSGPEVDPAALYAADVRSPRPDRPWVLANMIASADGATALDGVSGGLGGPADHKVFAAIRAVADIVLVAAGTVRAEHYGPPRPSPERRAERVARGQASAPRLAIVTASLDLDPSEALFVDAEERPLVITTTEAHPERVAALGAVAEIVVAGSGLVDLGATLTTLRRDHGAGIVLTEGGPSLIGALVGAGLLDELCLTMAPLLAGGTSPRVAHGPGHRTPMLLDRVLEADGLLFTRYVRAKGS